MPSDDRQTSLLYEDDWFLLEASAECTVPGYLVLRLKGPATALGQLAPEAAVRLGPMLSRAASAVEAATGAERIYVLSFGEVDRRLHFHLFPRTPWLAKAWRDAHPESGGPVDGPRLFVWARTTFVPGQPLPEGAPDPGPLEETLRATLAGAGGTPASTTVR